MSNVRRAMKNVVGNYSDIQVKVREATSNDPWGPSGALMSDIADATYNVIAFDEIVGLLWKRLNDSGKNWRHVYKALVVLDYIMKTGSDRVGEHCRDNIFTIQTLKDFVFVDKDGKDQGANVREKSKQLVLLLKDQERLGYERSKAIKAKERFHSTTPVGSNSSTPKRRNSVDGSHSTSAASRPVASPARANRTPNNLSPNSGSQSATTTRRAASSTPTRSDTRQSTTGSDKPHSLQPGSEAEAALQFELALQLSKEEANAAEAMRQREESIVRAVEQSTAPPEPFFSADNGFGSSGPPAAASGDPWASVSTSQPAAAAAPAPATSNWESFGNEEAKNPNVAPVVDPWGDSPKASSSSNGFGSQPFSTQGAAVPAAAAPMFSPPIQEPDSLEKKFLGNNGTLVNFNSLSVASPEAKGASSNPFGSTSPLAGTGMKPQPSNPFQKDKPQSRSLNEMRDFGGPAVAVGGDVLLPAPLVPESQSDVRRGSAPVVTPGRTIPPPAAQPMQPVFGVVGMVPAYNPMAPVIPVQPAMGMQPMAPVMQTGGAVMAPSTGNPFMPASTARAGNLHF